MASWGTYFRWASLAVVVAAGSWLLWPRSGDDSVTGIPQRRNYGGGVKHVIKFVPGPQYMPGTTPFGLGAPLRGIAEVVRDFEERFPDTRVEFVSVPGVREYLVTQLSSGNAPDIVMVNVEDVWVDVQKGWYVALDPYLEAPNPFIREKGNPSLPGYEQWWDMFKYQAISRGKAAPDNLNYCISFDMVETGIFYNKDIFREVGVEPPETWDDWLLSMEKVKAAGYIPLLMNRDSFNDWAVDLVFDQLYCGILPGIDLVQEPVREAYLQGYLDWDELCFLFEQGFFTQKDPRYCELWKHLHDLRQYCNQNLMGTDLAREFVTQRAAMLWMPTPFTYRLTGDRQLAFEWGIFYVPQFTRKTSDYASNTPMCVIGGSGTQYEVTNSAFGDTGDPATSERLKRVMALLQFIMVPEQYERVVNEYASLLPNVVGVPVLASIQPFADILERQYTTTKWIFTFDLKFADIQARMLELYLNDGIGQEEFMRWQVDNLNTATRNLLLRKDIDMARLEKRWRELAPVREAMEGLPRE